MSDEQRDPTRLVQTLGPAGDCLREVLAQPEQVLPPRFALLQQRRARRVRWQRSLLLSALALVVVGGHALRRENGEPSIRAELTTGSSRLPTAVPRASRLEQPPAATKAVARLARSAEAERPPLGADATGGEVEAGTAKACAQLARDGAAEQALGCYKNLSGIDGISAELALFEQARLEGKVLRQPERALRTLSDYRRRFPNGSLRGEAMLAQIDWLLAAGDSAQALRVVDEALGSGLLRERTAELERLRATLSAQPVP